MRIPIFIGYDKRERAATNVLIDSLYQKSSVPLSITPLITENLIKSGLYFRKRDPKQSTDFSFTRFLVPFLMNYEGWAIFMDCDMLCEEDISELWDQRVNNYSLMCYKHNHIPTEQTKFQGETQTSYPKKNWSSLMLFNCNKCKALSVNYVNNASGLDLHRFNWLDGDHLIGEIKDQWNFLVGVNDFNKDEFKKNKPKMLHWTLGGPWFKDQVSMGGHLSAKWFKHRDDAMKLWD